MLRQMMAYMGIKLMHLKNNFMYLWLCWGFVAAWAFLQLWQAGAPLELELSAAHKVQRVQASVVTAHGLRGCSSRLQNMAQQLQQTGLVAQRHGGSSWIRDRKPLSPALAGRFFNTEPAGKPGQEISKEPVDNVTCHFSKH